VIWCTTFFFNSTFGEGGWEDRLQAAISHVRFTERRELYLYKKKLRRIYKHITEYESKYAACSTNFNFDDMGISLDVSSCNIPRGYEQSMARARRRASVPAGFLHFKTLELVKMLSFRTYFHYLLLQAARRGAVVSATALQGNRFDSRWCNLNFSLP